MAKITARPDGASFELEPTETVLEAGLRAGVGFAHACGGQAKCSTCRVSIVEGLDACAERTPAEAAMAHRLRLPDDVRLACQLRASGDLSLRRLVLDDTDLAMSSQLDRSVITRSGETQCVTIFFSDINGFTEISETLPPYDVMYMLNRYFAQVGEIIERRGGFIDKFVGDGVMAIFGIEEDPDAPLAAVAAAVDTLGAVDRMRPFFAENYGIDFDIRIGLHYGEAVLGSLGSIGHERLTAIGDVVNLASRIETANKEAGTRLLISETLHAEVEDEIEVSDFVRIRPKGTAERVTLYEIAGITADARARLDGSTGRETMVHAGKRWTRALEADALGPDEWRVVSFDEADVVIARRGETLFAFNNACPHLNIPLFESRDMQEGDLGNFPGTEIPRPLHSTFTPDMGLTCRWHNSSFDLHTGEVREWVPALQEDGTSPGSEFIGDMSKNRCALRLYPVRVQDEHIWLSME